MGVWAAEVRLAPGPISPGHLLRQSAGRDQVSSLLTTPGAALLFLPHLRNPKALRGFVQGQGRLPPEVGDEDLPPVAHVEDLDGPV